MGLRRTISYLGRRRTFPRRFPESLGGARFLGSTEGGLKHLKRDVAAIDPLLTWFSKQYVSNGAVVWDIGANLGLFTFMAAGLAGPGGQVVAVEADAWLVETIRRSVHRNPGLAPVSVVPAAAADVPGLSRFEIAQTSRATSHLEGGSSSQTGGIRETQYVPTLTLDSLLEHFAPPSVVKIDVERSEARVLRGADRLLRHARPVLLVEVGSEVASEVAEILRSANYHLFDAESQKPIPSPAYATLALPDDTCMQN